ncbi:unnamed protein product [Paramecium pentaurelia]|uniref:WD40-repeat-containing domain n=1 Tax=Paramecium pentaurelia TaxID=43138 RepID=A0A8S1U2W1_9CILI|nr:unnamed protein product [Paramecium pentaurelia]
MSGSTFDQKIKEMCESMMKDYSQVSQSNDEKESKKHEKIIETSTFLVKAIAFIPNKNNKIAIAGESQITGENQVQIHEVMFNQGSSNNKNNIQEEAYKEQIKGSSEKFYEYILYTRRNNQGIVNYIQQVQNDNLNIQEIQNYISQVKRNTQNIQTQIQEIQNYIQQDQRNIQENNQENKIDKIKNTILSSIQEIEKIISQVNQGNFYQKTIEIFSKIVEIEENNRKMQISIYEIENNCQIIPFTSYENNDTKQKLNQLLFNNDTITAIHFPKNQNNSLEFVIGTKNGHFFSTYINLDNNQQNHGVQIHSYNQNEYKIKKQDGLHQGQISCILSIGVVNNSSLYENNDKLVILTSGYDSQILQFKMDSLPKGEGESNNESLLIEKLYEVDNSFKKHGHKEAIFWLSLSEEEKTQQTQNLISSGYEGYFFIWQRKTHNFKWNLIYKYKRSSVGARVAYFGQDQIVWQVFQQNYVNILTNLSQQHFMKSQDVAQHLKLENLQKVQFYQQQIENNIEKYDNDKFPLLYNDEKKIMVIKHASKICFLNCYQQRSVEGQQRQTQQKRNDEIYFQFLNGLELDCNVNCTEGAISSNGTMLAVSDNFNKIIKIYRLDHFL